MSQPNAFQRPEGAHGRMPDPAGIERPWLASYPPGVPPTYQYPDVPLTRFLDDAARDFPDLVAVHFEGAELTYAQLLDQVDRLATALADLGVAKGEPVAVILPNIPANVIATFAILRLGAVVVQVNPVYTEDELQAQLADSGCAVACCLAATLPRLNAVRARLPQLRHVIATGLQEWLPRRKRLLFPLLARRSGSYRRVTARDEALSLTELVDAAAPIARQAQVHRDDVAVLQYTGGTTGVSKGVMLTHGNLVANSFQARLWVPDMRAGKERILAAMPFFHIYALTLGMFTAMLSAATLVLMARFDAEAALALIDDQRPTLFPGVPTMYRAIIDHPAVSSYDLSSIRACVSGAAPLPEEVSRRFEEITGGARLREGYGLSEAGPLTHANPIYGRSVRGKIGLPVTDTVAIVVDPEEPTRVLAPGERGELAIHGPQVMAGYWKQPDETAQVLRDGWLLTGDIAVMSEDGTFEIVDRRKDIILSGGHNIYPREVEDVLYQHPMVASAVVVGLPDAYRGEMVKAYVVLLDGPRVTAEELDTHCRQHLSGYKVPRAYEIRDELPVTKTGKMLRRELRAEEAAAAQGDHDRDDEVPDDTGDTGDTGDAGDPDSGAGA